MIDSDAKYQGSIEKTDDGKYRAVVVVTRPGAAAEFKGPDRDTEDEATADLKHGREIAVDVFGGFNDADN